MNDLLSTEEVKLAAQVAASHEHSKLLDQTADYLLNIRERVQQLDLQAEGIDEKRKPLLYILERAEKGEVDLSDVRRYASEKIMYAPGHR